MKRRQARKIITSATEADAAVMPMRQRLGTRQRAIRRLGGPELYRLMMSDRLQRARRNGFSAAIDRLTSAWSIWASDLQLRAAPIVALFRRGSIDVVPGEDWP